MKVPLLSVLYMTGWETLNYMGQNRIFPIEGYTFHSFLLKYTYKFEKTQYNPALMCCLAMN